MADSWLTHAEYLTYGYEVISEEEFPQLAAKAALAQDQRVIFGDHGGHTLACSSGQGRSLHQSAERLRSAASIRCRCAGTDDRRLRWWGRDQQQ